MGEDTAVLRRRMVNNQLRTFDVTDHRVQDAFLEIPRERYVPADKRAIAYSDEAITIVEAPRASAARTMSPPAILARLLQLAQIDDEDVVLLVGSGTGYTAALIGCLASSVIALECDEDLAADAAARLEGEEVTNVVVVTGPLPDGYPSEAPFDVIFCDGALEETPQRLLDQMKEGGRLVCVEGKGLAGRATLFLRTEKAISRRASFNAAAAPLPGFSPAPTFIF
ncbi:MAG: protein-L-isoaspartate O-methyltransferase [Pseudomonadota bacterium]